MRVSRVCLVTVAIVLSSTVAFGQGFGQMATETLERLAASAAATALERQALVRAKALVSTGQFDEAALLLERQAAKMSAAPRVTEPGAARLKALSEALKLRRTRLLAALNTPSGVSRQVAYNAGLRGSQLSMFVSLSAVSTLPLKTPRWVESSVRQFGQDWLTGARDPGRYVSELLQSAPPEGRLRVNQWLRSQSRHFVIAPNADAARVEELRAAIARQGGAAFFYQDCLAILGRLCSSETVGAFFAQSQETLVSRSGAASASEYIPVELLAAMRFHQGQDEVWLMVTTQDVVSAVTAGATRARVVAIEVSSQ